MKTRTRARLVSSAWSIALSLSVIAAVQAADHSEAPGTRADQPADLADVYVWHDNATNKLVGVITFAGLEPPSKSRGTFDENVLYSFNIDNDGDFISDIDVLVRFALDDKGKWWMHVVNLPGTSAPITAPVNRPFTTNNGCRLFAGLRDDPFFFDLEGFRATLQTGTLSFDGNRDSVAGLNATAIVMEMDLGVALDGGTVINVWATTARK